MSEYQQQLQDLLRELFQFDSADLDFGIYAVMNTKRDEVERFIEHDLLDAIAQGLQLQSDAQQVKAREEFDQARQKLQAEYGDETFDAQGNLTSSIIAMPGQTAKHLREAYLSAQRALTASALSGELEAQTYNDLYRFFARYYDNGDFISQRRYGQGNKYAIPYNGEEVFLYWANFDQYYVKTGETFADYRFTVEPALGFDAATVHFKLRQASVEQNNVKGDKRFFVRAAGDEVQWDAASRTLVIGFEYRLLADDEQLRAGSRDQQEKLNAETAAAVLRAVADLREHPFLTVDTAFSEEIGGRAVPVVRVLGEDGAGRRVCVLWRDAPPLEEMEAEKQWLQASVLADVAYDLLYINGESALPDALPMEAEFKRLMFEGVS